MGDLIERLIDEADGYGDGPVVVHDIEGLRALLREAAAALEAAREDAERYRWLRDEANTARKSDPMVGTNPLGHSSQQDLLDGTELDAAIDQARGKGGQEVGK